MPGTPGIKAGRPLAGYCQLQLDAQSREPDRASAGAHKGPAREQEAAGNHRQVTDSCVRPPLDLMKMTDRSADRASSIPSSAIPSHAARSASSVATFSNGMVIEQPRSGRSWQGDTAQARSICSAIWVGQHRGMAAMPGFLCRPSPAVADSPRWNRRSPCLQLSYSASQLGTPR
jgi:hypothetical protein